MDHFFRSFASLKDQSRKASIYDDFLLKKKKIQILLSFIFIRKWYHPSK